MLICGIRVCARACVWLLLLLLLTKPTTLCAGHHKSLFLSWDAKSYPESVQHWSKDQKPSNSHAPTGLFEKIRLPGLSLMYKVGYGPQCCRGSNGDANTPYNSTCSGKDGALSPHATWLNVPLIFNMSVDVAESTPLIFGTYVCVLHPLSFFLLTRGYYCNHHCTNFVC